MSTTEYDSNCALCKALPPSMSITDEFFFIAGVFGFCVMVVILGELCFSGI